MATPAASPITTPQAIRPIQASLEKSSEKNFVASPSIAYAEPAPIAISRPAERPSSESPYGTSAIAARMPMATSVPAPPACSESRGGAAQARSAIPATIVLTLRISRFPTRSPSTREPMPSSTTRLIAKAGSTRVSGMSSSAPTCAIQPTNARPVPISQRGRVTSLRRRDRRRCCSFGDSRASRACRPTAVA